MSTREEETCFGERGRRRDYLGLISFGAFLLIVGIVFIANPNMISDIRSWAEQMANQKDLVRPPEGLIVSGVLFFGLLGVSDFLKAGIRFWVDKSRRRVLAEICSGIALVFFAYLISLYGNNMLAWHMVFAAEAVAVGLLIIVYSIARYGFLK